MTKRLALIARVDNKGLGQQTAAVWRNMGPAKTLVVLMGRLAALEEHPERFGTENVRCVTYDRGRLPHDAMHWLLEDVDAVFTAETPYDFSLFRLARKRSVRTVLHLNPELDHHHRYPDHPRPDVVALPTTWLANRYPNSVSLPMPVEPLTIEARDAALHPAGWPAAKDRNGTRLVLEASRSVGNVVVRAQAAPDQPWHRATVEVGDVASRSDVFAGAGIVVLPRRYGGLCLPLQEAMASGLPVLHTDCAPYGSQLPTEARLAARRTGSLEMKGGSVPVFSTTPEAIANAVRDVRNDPDLAAFLSATSLDWAKRHSWEALRPTWDSVLFG